MKRDHGRGGSKPVTAIGRGCECRHVRDSVWPLCPCARRRRRSIRREPEVDAGRRLLDGGLVTLGWRRVFDDGEDSTIVDLEWSDHLAIRSRTLSRDRPSPVEQQCRAEGVDGVKQRVDEAGLDDVRCSRSCEQVAYPVGGCGRAGHHDVAAEFDDSGPPRRRGSVRVRPDHQQFSRREPVGGCVRQVAPQGSDSVTIGRRHSDQCVRRLELEYRLHDIVRISVHARHCTEI